jgi:hypothetical protein
MAAGECELTLSGFCRLMYASKVTEARMSESHQAKPIEKPTSNDRDGRSSGPELCHAPEIEILNYSGTPPAVRSSVATRAAFRRMPASRIAVVVGGGFALILALGTLARYSLPNRSPGDASSAATQALAPSEEAETVLAQEGTPVRFVNPFDKGEVFEFPPGTTRDEARDAVAEILRARATERQRPATAPKTRAARLP